jgi:hypothetical protein
MVNFMFLHIYIIKLKFLSVSVLYMKLIVNMNLRGKMIKVFKKILEFIIIFYFLNMTQKVLMAQKQIEKFNEQTVQKFSH